MNARIAPPPRGPIWACPLRRIHQLSGGMPATQKPHGLTLPSAVLGMLCVFALRVSCRNALDTAQASDASWTYLGGQIFRGGTDSFL